MGLSPTKPTVSSPSANPLSAAQLLQQQQVPVKAPEATKYVIAKMADGRSVRLTQEQYQQIVASKKTKEEGKVRFL